MTENTPTLRTVVHLCVSDSAYLSHRLPMANAAIKDGYKIIVCAPDTGHAASIQRLDMMFYPLMLDRGGMNPWHDLKSLIAIIKMLRTTQPDILHATGIKPCLYGGIAAMFSSNIRSLLALSGLGHMFTGQPHFPKGLLAAFIGKIIAMTGNCK
ncbi:MAG: glycosyltransferase, partial [Pseudomonadota bacterium]